MSKKAQIYLIKIYILPKSHHTSKAKFFRLFFCQLINIIATCHANIPIAEQLFTVFHLEMLVSMLYPAKSSAPYRAVHHINRSFFVHVSCLFSLATKQCGISLFLCVERLALCMSDQFRTLFGIKFSHS